MPWPWLRGDQGLRLAIGKDVFRALLLKHEVSKQKTFMFCYFLYTFYTTSIHFLCQHHAFLTCFHDVLGVENVDFLIFSRMTPDQILLLMAYE